MDTPGCHADDERNICFSNKGAKYTEFHGWDMDAETRDNYAFIVAAVNACFAINPENPLAVAEAIPEMARMAKAWLNKSVDFTFIVPKPQAEAVRAALAKIEAKP